MAEALSGVIERVTFHNMDNGYAVLRVTTRGRRDLVTVVGHIPAAIVGEYIEGQGTWVTDPAHGVQFKAELLRSTPPHTAEGIIKYLGSGLVRGIGTHYAKKIVEVFGERTLEVIDASPTFLSEIKGIGPRRLQQIRQSWQEQKAVRSIMVFLQSYGIGTSRAIRIFKTYGEQAIEMVRANPYRLTTDVWGFGFKTADQLALKLGTPPDSPHRARAVVRYVLQERATRGDVAYPLASVVELGLIAVEEHPLQAAVIEQAIEIGRQESEFVRDTPPGAEEPLLYLKPMFMAELGVARALNQLSQGDHPLQPIDHEKAVAWVESRMGIELAPTQREAIEAALRQKVLVITGGPGVGKTTIVRGIIEVFASRNQRIGLAAPTGRAAKRLSESTGRDARTIHRLLEFDPSFGGFLRTSENPLEIDLLVIDEASMVDIVLMNQLLRAVPPWACLVLVGDVDQLPSVGPGSVLADVIRSGVVPVVRLTKIFRQAGTSWIIRAAHAIHAGEMPESAPPGEGDFYFVEASEPEAILEKLVMMVRERIPAKFGLDPVRDVQVLSPANKGLLGVVNLNQHLQAALNTTPGGKQVERFGTQFRVGDKVIQTQNDYTKEVFNGDIGRIEAIDAVGQEVTIDFEGRKVVYEFSELDELALAYATSIHKSQGSEYAAVVIPLHTQHYTMLQRNLIYTGLTRGKRLVVLVGSRRALSLAVRNDQTGERYSMLADRLRELKDAGGGDEVEPQRGLPHHAGNDEDGMATVDGSD